MLELHTFGGLELRTAAGERVEALAGRTKYLALLAYLAVEARDGRVPREKVAALLWPDRTDDRARNSLRVALSHIRQATVPALVAGEGASSLGLARDHVRADVAVFRDALEAGEERRALELYGGEFLAGVNVEGARPFRRWADRTRGHLRQEAYGAALSAGTSAREAGDLAAAEDAFRRALDLAPLREEAAEKLIRTLADRGRPADALQLYEAFRERREAELEMAPSEELRQRVEGLKRAPSAASGAAAEKPAVENAPSDPVDSSAEAFEGGPDPTSDGRSGREPSRSRRFRRRTLVGALAAVGLLGAILAAAWHLVGAGDDAGPPGVGDRSVAVLPFGATGTEDPDPIAAGLHSDLLTRLSTVGDLEVISATSVERFRGADLPLPSIAESLGVTWVLEGHVQRAGDGIEVNAQLIDPRTDTHAWANTYRRELTAESLFDLQSDITRRIAAALETRVKAGEEDRLDRRATGSLPAHRFYVRGRSLLEQRHEPEMRRSLDYFEQALAEDSSYALAWAGRADVLSVLARHPDTDPDTLLPSAAEAVDRALALEPDLAEAHTVRGRLHMYRREGPAALQAFRRAVELKPSHAAAHAWLGKLLLSLGRPEAALASAERSVELDPMSVENQGTLCYALLATGRYEEALVVAREIDELARRPHPNLNHALSHLGRTDELKRRARERERPEPGSLVYWFYLAAAGDTAAASEVLAEIDESRTPLVAAIAQSFAGRQERAFELLEDAYPRTERPWDLPFTVWLRHLWPERLEPLREDPRYERFIREMNTYWGLNPDGSLPEGTRELRQGDGHSGLTVCRRSPRGRFRTPCERGEYEHGV
jgi:DNA-binding SARP family transcriptional activator/TolB-like protein